MSLSDKIWTTRKSRIYAEKRLQRNAIVFQILMTIYSASLVILSIWNTLNPNDQINITLIFSSIAVLVTSIVLSSQRYNECSLSMRNCYIRLDELHSKSKNAERNNENTLLQQIESEYTTTLLNVENHTDYDYLRLRFSLRNNQDTTLPPFTKTPLLTVKKLEEMGLRIVIFPRSAPCVAAKAIQELMLHLQETGSTQGFLDRIVTFEERTQIRGLAKYKEMGGKYLALK